MRAPRPPPIGSATVTGFTSVDWDKLANPLIADFTRKVAEEALIGAVRGGFDNEPVVVTDGVPFRDYADVKPFGKIEFIRRPVMAECARWMMARLVAIAPVGPDTCTEEPPNTAATIPATMAVTMPAVAPTPDATPKPSAKGSATIPTVTPATRSPRHERLRPS